MRQTNKIRGDKKLALLHREGAKAFYVYEPTPFSLLYHHFEKMTFSRRVRLLMEYFSKGRYQVFYLAVEDILVGHCVAAPGNRRLKRSSRADMVIGPYFVDGKYRGNGYAKELVKWTLETNKGNYRYAYVYIKKNNLPSIKASTSCGFRPCGELDIEGFLHNLVERSGGEYTIYQFDPSQNLSALTD